MARFVVRRMASAILLLFAVSIVVFGIFEVIPSYNPARAIAGRNATPTTVAEVSHSTVSKSPGYPRGQVCILRPNGDSPKIALASATISAG